MVGRHTHEASEADDDDMAYGFLGLLYVAYFEFDTRKNNNGGFHFC